MTGSPAAGPEHQAIVAATAHMYLRSKGDPAATELLLRVHSLLAVHASVSGGTLIPSGVDVALARFPHVHAAIEAALALQDEIEAARPEGHRHGKLVGLGIAAGPLVELPDGRVLGVPAARALRLAMLAGPAGDVLLDERSAQSELPAGLGRHEGRRSMRDLLGFGFHHLADYR